MLKPDTTTRMTFGETIVLEKTPKKKNAVMWRKRTNMLKFTYAGSARNELNVEKTFGKAEDKVGRRSK